jgi:hypothetical protein
MSSTSGRSVSKTEQAGSIDANAIPAIPQPKIPALKRVLSSPRRKPLQVVELGAGCGIAGIAWVVPVEVLVLHTGHGRQLGSINIARYYVLNLREVRE